MRILVVDNYDSFTYNLVDYLHRAAQSLGISAEVQVVYNDDKAALDDAHRADAVVLSPGPGSPHNPADVGLSSDILATFSGPILGVCLGMQLMVTHLGGTVGRAPEPVHGRTSPVRHDGSGLFRGIDNPHEVVRYHSLCATTIPRDLRVTATTCSAGAPEIVMAVEHRERPWWGVQFHPESIGDTARTRLIEDFLRLALEESKARANAAYCVRRVGRALDPEGIAKHVLSGHRFWIDAGGFHILGDATGPRAQAISYDLARDDYDFFSEWNASFRELQIPGAGPIPGCPFALGWVGYLGYELGELCGIPDMPRYPGPDAQFIFCDRAIVIDPEADETYLLSFAGDDEWGDTEWGDTEWIGEAGSFAAQGNNGGAERSEWAPGDNEFSSVTPVHGKGEYLRLIRRAQEYIRAGESYEVCLTNRLEMPPVSDPLAAYGRLRAQNLTGRTGYLDFGDTQILSTTPECFLMVDASGVVTSKPIKGTRPRGSSKEEDGAIARDLATHPKDRSENLMIVDLVRNDLARVCEDIQVPKLCAVETYPTVHQFVSTVTGRLSEDNTPIDALRAAFPGGSMTGAPKIRSMRIISELEGTWRGPYSGAFGYLSLNGAADFSMIIRTLVNTPDQARATYGVGGAILHLSDPEEEFAETQVKARALGKERVSDRHR